MSDSLWPHGLYSPRNSPGHNTGVGNRPLLQDIFPTQGSNPGLTHFRWILYQLSHKGSPWILEWVAYPFSSRSSQPRNRIGVSCTAGEFFTSWATREAHLVDIFENFYKWVRLCVCVCVCVCVCDLMLSSRKGTWDSTMSQTLFWQRRKLILSFNDFTRTHDC